MTAVGTVVGTREASAGRRALLKVLRNPSAVAGALALASVGLALAAAPWLAPDDPLAADVTRRFAGFSRAHPLGTDGIGRDMLARMLYGGRTSVLLTLAITAIVTVLGVLLGVLAGIRGGVLDSTIMRIVETVQSVPLIIIAIVTVKLLGGGAGNLVFILAAVGWTGMARVIRAATLSLRERQYIESCLVAGGSEWRVMFRHVVPNLLGPIVVIATLDVGRFLLAVSTLSFLGFGAQPPTPEWGSMLAENRIYFFVAARLLVIPGLAIFTVALAANLFGEGLRDAFEARMTRS